MRISINSWKLLTCTIQLERQRLVIGRWSFKEARYVVVISWRRWFSLLIIEIDAVVNTISWTESSHTHRHLWTSGDYGIWNYDSLTFYHVLLSLWFWRLVDYLNIVFFELLIFYWRLLFYYILAHLFGYVIWPAVFLSISSFVDVHLFWNNFGRWSFICHFLFFAYSFIVIFFLLSLSSLAISVEFQNHFDSLLKNWTSIIRGLNVIIELNLNQSSFDSFGVNDDSRSL